MPTELTLRPGTAQDLPAVADLHLRVRRAAVPAMPAPIHDADDVRRHVSGWDLAGRALWLAEADSLLGYAVVEGDWLDSLYVDPAAQGEGVGSALLEVVESLRPGGFCLWVFESNAPAREFYRHRGLVELERTDGAANEERAPDLRMAWPGADPLAFFRTLIDDVDVELGDLLARRAALTRAVQAHKPDRARDPDREREIARALAGRAPALGEQRLTRIVQAIISESLDAARDEATS